MKDISNFKAPYLSYERIWQEAENLFAKHGHGNIPVDIEDIIEFGLGLDYKPIHNLYSLCCSDAFLSPNCKVINVDFDHFFNTNTHFYLRYSLAHEVGHLILHKDIMDVIRPANIQEWKNVILNIPEKEYNWIEWHAYEFAGRLLFPKERLIQELLAQKTNIKKAYNIFPEILDDDVIKQVSAPISKIFQVSDEVISRRIKIEKVWDLVKSK
ncbi:MAG: ImmA/IrrE family metallo-endopeptidase [Ignavibacteriaceae bacterium]